MIMEANHFVQIKEISTKLTYPNHHSVEKRNMEAALDYINSKST